MEAFRGRASSTSCPQRVCSLSKACVEQQRRRAGDTSSSSSSSTGCWGASIDGIDLLVHWNKSLTAQVDKDGSTPLHFASSVYFSTGSRIHTLSSSADPLGVVFNGFPGDVHRNLEKVFSANHLALYQADKNGSFPIHVAASAGAVCAIKLFVDTYPDSADLRDAKGRTFFHVAVDKERLGIVTAVCRDRSLAWILNIQDNEGNTALHLAIQARSFKMFCALFGNQELNLNLTNNHGETPLDLSRNKLPFGMDYAHNPEYKIHRALWSVGANQGALRWDKIEEMYRQRTNPEYEDKESERLKDATQTLIIVSVLIATVAFSATFALPGGFIADDHTNGGTPTLAGSYVFDAFMMATTLAFICSALATGGFAVAAIHMINLRARRKNFLYRCFSCQVQSHACLLLLRWACTWR